MFAQACKLRDVGYIRDVDYKVDADKNHSNFANPGGENGEFGLTDPSAGQFGCGCATPDVAAANPVLGSGSHRAIPLGLKFIF